MPADASFKAFRRFNDESLRPLVGLRKRLDERSLPYFTSARMSDRIAVELARRRALPVKELFESFEFYERTARRVRGPDLADLCCGHGLTGLLFAAFERRVERVTLLDRKRPASYDGIREAVCAIAPWAEAKVRYLEVNVRRAPELLEPGTAVVAVHACGVRTDRCIDAALATGGSLAVMPCCYHKTAHDAPRVLRRELGAELRTDVHRTYRLEREGYSVDWAAVPRAITPMNRILVATRDAAHGA